MLCRCGAMTGSTKTSVADTSVPQSPLAVTAILFDAATSQCSLTLSHLDRRPGLSGTMTQLHACKCFEAM